MKKPITQKSKHWKKREKIDETWAVVAWWWRKILLWSSSTKGVTDGSRELSKRTSWAVMIALMCSRFITIARSRPNTVDGYERSGSKIRRSRAGRPVRLMIACLPASITSAWPVESTTIQALTPVAFFRWGAEMGRAVSGSSSVMDRPGLGGGLFGTWPPPLIVLVFHRNTDTRTKLSVV